MTTIVDKTGKEIKSGHILYNPYDRDKYHEIISDNEGNLYLGDFDSPIARYAPHLWWEIVPKIGFKED